MADEKSQEEMLEEQKKNCPFCKIGRGEIPTSEVYEDDAIKAVLDINPIVKGQTLVMTKEHFFIMSVITPQIFKRMFHDVRVISAGMKKALMVPYTSLFIASGGIAGQQLPHFSFYIFPQEKQGAVSQISIAPNKEKKKENDELAEALKQNLSLMMQRHAQREGKNFSSPTPGKELTPEQIMELKREQIARVLEDNPAAKQLLLDNPEEFKKQVAMREETKQLFEGVDIEGFSKNLREHESKKQPEEPASEISKEEVVQESSRPKAEVFLGEDPLAQKNKVFAYFDEKPKAKALLKKDPAHFKELLANRSDVQEIFKDVNIDKLAEKLVEVEGVDDE